MGKKSKRKSVKQARPGDGSSGGNRAHVYPKLQFNDRVVLWNLSTQQYNGKVGTVVSLPKPPLDSSSRYGILVDGSEKAIGIQAKNLLPVFKIGDHVSLHGLASKDYNGRYGTVIKVPESLSKDDPRYGIQLDGKDNAIGIRAENIHLVNRMTTQQQKEARERLTSHMEPSEGATLDANHLAMMRTMTNMFLTEEQQFQLYGRKIVPIPDFHRELFAEGLPERTDRSWADGYLRLAYEQASGVPHNFEMVMKTPRYKPEPRDIYKRLGNNDPEKIHWYFNATAVGAINANRRVTPYCPFFRHSFSNQTYRKEQLHRGTTHVAVGFVDLGMLFVMNLADPPSNSRFGPLQFVGVEMSAYSVAKTHLLWEMLQQTPHSSPQRVDHLRSVLQVWYSTTWGKGTETTVKRCLHHLCQSERYYHPDVREILEHWADATSFSLEAARAEIAQATTNSNSNIGHFLRHQDRVAMAKYELTGDFSINGKIVCGNTIMFDCPDGTPPLEKDESIFSALNTYDIMDLLKENTGMTIVEAAEKYAIEKLADFAYVVQSGEVSLELICAKFEEVVDDIAARKPWTMSWSNLLDYLDYAEFHQLAHRCSVHGDTIHFGYSMNWVTEVLGVNIIDFTRSEEQVARRIQIFDAANQAAQFAYHFFGWNAFLRFPPPTNPINTTSNYVLETTQYRNWARHFFDIAHLQGPCQVANVEHKPGTSPFSNTGSSTVYLTWTYDPEINFRSANPHGILTEESMF